jgi:hypothetical protein
MCGRYDDPSMHDAISIYVVYLFLAGVCALNVYLALTIGEPLNWATAVFIGLIALRPSNR